MTPGVWTIKEILGVTTDYLRKKEIENPRLNAEILLAHQLKVGRIHLYLNFDQPLNDRELSGYRILIKRRLQREPLQYITGSQEFWSLDFLVNPSVLIPRPETERLVEVAIDILKEDPLPEGRASRVLDLGTGSGAIAISLAHEVGGLSLYASDISVDALEVARLNARRHHLEEKLHFVHGDLFEPFKSLGLMFDLILSNPPYIASGGWGTLPPEVRDFEPEVALKAHEGGMFYIEKIIKEGPAYLIPGGWLLLEMDPGQTEKALGLISRDHRYTVGQRVKDYSQRHRVVMARKKGKGADLFEKIS